MNGVIRGIDSAQALSNRRMTRMVGTPSLAGVGVSFGGVGAVSQMSGNLYSY